VTTEPLLSVVTPVRNGMPYIEALLDSVSALRVAHEHLVYDACSTDGTVDALRRREDVTWVSEPDRGQPHAVNKGLERASGRYVNWINADNAYVPGAIEQAVTVLEARPELAAVFGGMWMIDENGERRRYYVPAPWSFRRYLYVGDYVPTETIVFRRALLDEAGLLDERADDAADYDFYLRLLYGRQVTRLDAPLIFYRHHPQAKTTVDPHGIQAQLLAVRQGWARGPRDRAVMRAVDAAKRAILPRISTWPKPW
jgi:glycosyltransferase involved in cell wall biosynthesis